MDLEHAQSLDFSLRNPVASQRKPAHAADRVAADAIHAGKVAEWLRTEGFDIIGVSATSFRRPQIQVRDTARARLFAANGMAQAVMRGKDGQGEYAHFEFEYHGCCVHFVIPGA